MAARLLVEVEALAARRGYRFLRLTTGTEQPEALRLYEKAGWVRDESATTAEDPTTVYLAKELPRTARSDLRRQQPAQGEAPRTSSTEGITGEADLSVLLARMAAELLPSRYVFATIPAAELTPEVGVLASVVEPEGLSLVTTQEQADQAGLSYDFVAGWITLRVHSALHAVGLTAAVSTALAGAGISCNVIAGHHHDHLLVPIDRSTDALVILRTLASLARDEAASSG